MGESSNPTRETIQAKFFVLGAYGDRQGLSLSNEKPGSNSARARHLRRSRDGCPEGGRDSPRPSRSHPVGSTASRVSRGGALGRGSPLAGPTAALVLIIP